MAVGRRVVIIYLLAVWCCADRLVVRALPPGPVQCHEEPAVSSGDPIMGALQGVTSPDHHHHHDLRIPDRLKQPETSISIDPVTVSDPLASVIAGGVCACNSPASPRTKHRGFERWTEGSKQEGSEKGSSLGGGADDSVVIGVRESEEEDGNGTGSANADKCAICLEKMEAEGEAGGISTMRSWIGCGHRFHMACSQGLLSCPLCRCSPTGVAASVLPPTDPEVHPDGPLARTSRSLIDRLTCGYSRSGVAAWVFAFCISWVTIFTFRYYF